MRFLIWTLIFFSFFTIAYGVNQTGDSLLLDAEGWCPTLPIEFRVYNESEFSIREDIEDDDDRNFSYISSASVKIYNGPLDSLPLLAELKTDANGTFEYTFPSKNDYLILITPQGNYSRLETFIEIESCSRGLTSLNEADKTNKSFSFLQGALTLNLTLTQLNESEISVQRLTNDSTFQKSTTFPSPYLDALEITGLSKKNSSKIVLKYDLENISAFESLYYYNSSSKTWEEEENANILNELLVFSTNVSGIYLITQKNQSEKEIQVETLGAENEEEFTSLTRNNTSNESETSLALTQEETTKGSSSSLILIFSLLLLLAGGGFGVHYFFIRKKEHGDLSLEMKEKDKGKTQDELKQDELLTSYQQIYEHSKNYVLQYKEEYSKDQLFRALKNANVSEDLINKVFDEVYEGKK